MAILVLGCLFINIIGYHLIFYFRQLEIKSEMKRLILAQPNSEDENDFVIPVDDKSTMAKLEWEGDDEFSFNGDMYDVIEKKVENNKLIIRSLADKRETALIKKYSKLNNEGNARGKTALLMNLVNSAYVFSSIPDGFRESNLKPFKIYFRSCIGSSKTQEVLTPPPQHC
jgi:hypothetical protein